MKAVSSGQSWRVTEAFSFEVSPDCTIFLNHNGLNADVLSYTITVEGRGKTADDAQIAATRGLNKLRESFG